MGKKTTRIKEIPLTTEGFQAACALIEEGLKRNRISREIASETMLVFEALFHSLTEQCFEQGLLLTVRVQRSFGELHIKLGFEGKPYIPIESVPEDASPEASILRAYNDKIAYRYSAGYNSIRIVVRRNYSSYQLSCFAGILLAILAWLPIRAGVSADAQLAIEARFVYPLIKLFSNAMLMVGAPITLFSMIKNLTDIYIIAERNSSGRRLQAKTFLTSGVSVALALGTSFLALLLFRDRAGYLAGFGTAMPLPEVIASLVPYNILAPFETFMPFPMILVALLITYAFCSVGEYFDLIKKAVNICYALFSKMLNVVMSALPFFCFLAMLTPLLTGGFAHLRLIVAVVLLLIVSLIVMIAFYLVRLLIGGVKLGAFLKRLPPLIWENLKINSAIDAVPYNIRYCARYYGFDRKRLTEKLPILAQTNLDGNCFLVMMIAMLLIFGMEIETSWLQILVIAILVLFLSFGAPGQPGGILIGTLIILYYLKAEDLISIAIYFEVFFGALQNLVNVVGDIVTVAVEEQKLRP